MNLSFSRPLLPAFIGAIMVAACNDNVSEIGSDLISGETTITLDSITYNLEASSIDYDKFDARSNYLMLGNLDVKEYGKLNCSFVTKFMCSTKIDVPDSILMPERVDSCKFLMGISRGDLTGDSLAPQKIAVYRLTKQLPADITNAFDPEGYYDPASPIATKSFTPSLISQNDSIFLNSKGFFIEVPVDKEIGKDLFIKYKQQPEIFQWPQTFAEYFPGIYVDPFFGKGCVANVQIIYFCIYYHYYTTTTSTVDGETVTTQNIVNTYTYPFCTAPEVLSSNNISYEVSDYIKEMVTDGDNVVTTPGGYLTQLRFPAQDLITRFNNGNHNLSMVNNLQFTIPAEVIENDYGIGVTPSLLLIKTSEMEDFFANNQLPDGKTSFAATYDSTNKQYTFSSMREYIVDLIEKGSVTEEDVDFTLVPVEITQEESSYYSTSTSYVTRCTPYTSKPTMTRLHTKDALIVFSFSSQYL
ncbi:MAG: DUF4270 domain-containing protein [Bacteroides sp.]|nr:DUF4270 domain-containing protein [Bacteroides sp.]